MIWLFAPIMMIFLLVTGCAATQTKAVKQGSQSTTSGTDDIKQLPQPKWIDGESKHYPRLDYMRSRSQAASAEEAAQMARTKLATMFMVDINTLDMSLHQAIVATGYDAVDAFSTEKIPLIASTEINNVLDKIEVVEQWHHLTSNTHHALAVLPRNIGKLFLRKEINRLDDNTSKLIDQGQTHNTPFTQLGMMSKAWRAQQIRSTLQKTMARADLTGRGIKPKWRLRNMERDIDSMLTSLQVYPTGLDGDMNARTMTAMLQGALKVAELTPAEKSSADYVIRAVVDTSIVGEENGWALGHGAIKVVLADKKNNRLLGSRQWAFQTPGLNEDHAKRRVLEKTEYMLKKNMRNILINMAMDAASSTDL